MSKTRQITIKLYTKEIDYDVGMITHVISNRMIGHGWTQEQGFNIANTQDHSGEVNLIARFEENAINELIGSLGRYLVEEAETHNNDLNDVLTIETYTFDLNVPLSFNLNFARPLKSAMHEFVVNRILYDWFLRTKPDEAVIYKGIYEEALDRVKSAINKRTGIARLKPYPRI